MNIDLFSSYVNRKEERMFMLSTKQLMMPLSSYRLSTPQLQIYLNQSSWRYFIELFVSNLSLLFLHSITTGNENGTGEKTKKRTTNKVNAILNILFIYKLITIFEWLIGNRSSETISSSSGILRKRPEKSCKLKNAGVGVKQLGTEELGMVEVDAGGKEHLIFYHFGKDYHSLCLHIIFYSLFKYSAEYDEITEVSSLEGFISTGGI